MKNNKIAKMGVIAVVLLLAVAFAAVSTRLNIGGSASVGAIADDLKDNLVFAKGEGTTAYLLVGTEKQEVTYEESDKKISFTAPKFTNSGDFAELHYWVENKSTNYTAELAALDCSITGINDADTDYLKLSVGEAHKNIQLKKGKTTDLDNTVRVELAKTYVGETDSEYTITCKIEATGVGQETSEEAQS